MNVWKEEVKIGKLFFVLLRVRTRRTEAKIRVGRMCRSSKSGLRGGGKLTCFLMQDDFTDDAASGKCLQLGE